MVKLLAKQDCESSNCTEYLVVANNLVCHLIFTILFLTLKILHLGNKELMFFMISSLFYGTFVCSIKFKQDHLVND